MFKYRKIFLKKINLLIPYFIEFFDDNSILAKKSK